MISLSNAEKQNCKFALYVKQLVWSAGRRPGPFLKSGSARFEGRVLQWKAGEDRPQAASLGATWDGLAFGLCPGGVTAFPFCRRIPEVMFL